MRSSGILLPVSSLPTRYGIGGFSREAYEFVDQLERAGQRNWQILPLGPTGYGDSPYQPFSSYAGNPYFIDLDELCNEGLLKPEEYQNISWGADPTKVDYGLLYENRFRVLGKAIKRLKEQRLKELTEFCFNERQWLDDYSLFMALKEKAGGAPWEMWAEPLKFRKPDAISAATLELNEEIWFWRGVQFLFFRQWEKLKKYASERGILIIGDLPIYVAEDSADVWAHPEVFQMDENLQPKAIAGCPPDGFSEDGQRWGNPLFDWERLKQDGYAWWINRIAFQFRHYDILRIDHFRGFESYYSIPRESKTAQGGIWNP